MTNNREVGSRALEAQPPQEPNNDVRERGPVLRARNQTPTYREQEIPFDDEDYREELEEAIVDPYVRTILDEEWDEAYGRSTKYGEIWKRVNGEEPGPWPKDVKLYGGKMYVGERLCVPEELLYRVIAAQHQVGGHLGVDRLVTECARRFDIFDMAYLKKMCTYAKKNCMTCAQTEPPSQQRKGKIGRFPIHPHVWDSICMDIVSMPVEYWEGERYDSFFVCVDRHTGWIVALPTLKAGLTSEKAARMIYNKWMDMGGGIPSVITSDLGSQFVGGWFRTMCSQLGIRQAHSQAYRAQANGRAERAGRQVVDWLGKLSLDAQINWVQVLPRMLQQYHDTIGESGFSPYYLMFGRYRHTVGIPYEPPGGCEDAVSFGQRMAMLDQKVAEVLNEKHDRMVESTNKNRREKKPMQIGSKVWVYKPTKVGGHRLESRWWGPARVVKQVGESSYEVQWESDRIQIVHLDDLKLWEEPPSREEEEEEEWGLRAEHRYEAQLEEEEPAEEQLDRPIEKILGHRVGPGGTTQFFVRKKGQPESEATWEEGIVLYRDYYPLFAEYAVNVGMEGS